METISLSGELASEFKKVEVNKLINIEKGGIVTGGDIMGAVRYYQDSDIDILIEGHNIDKLCFITEAANETYALGFSSLLEFYETRFDVSIDEYGNISYMKMQN